MCRADPKEAPAPRGLLEDFSGRDLRTAGPGVGVPYRSLSKSLPSRLAGRGRSSGILSPFASQRRNEKISNAATASGCATSAWRATSTSEWHSGSAPNRGNRWSLDFALQACDDLSLLVPLPPSGEELRAMSGAWSTPVRSSPHRPLGYAARFFEPSNRPRAAPLPRGSGWIPRKRSTSCAGARPCWRRLASVSGVPPGGADQKPA